MTKGAHYAFAISRNGSTSGCHYQKKWQRNVVVLCCTWGFLEQPSVYSNGPRKPIRNVPFFAHRFENLQTMKYSWIRNLKRFLLFLILRPRKAWIKRIMNLLDLDLADFSRLVALITHVTRTTETNSTVQATLRSRIAQIFNRLADIWFGK